MMLRRVTVLRTLALASAAVGGLVMSPSPVHSQRAELALGVPCLLAGVLLWLLSELRSTIDDGPSPAPRTRPQPGAERAPVVSAARLTVLGCSLLASFLAWTLNGRNLFTLAGVLAWLASILLWVWTLAPEGWTPVVALAAARRRLGSTRLRFNWMLAILLIILALGAYTRLADLQGTPPEMTSDHVEKLLDVNRVLHGETNVYFANNGGREAIQFYALALMSYLPGVRLNFYWLKVLTAVEGLLTLPVLWWMGREVIGREESRLGNVVGLTMAALVSVSYWHEALSRLGLRIVLTPLFVALVTIFLARAVRENRRSDFLCTGLALGFSVYAYQTDRMLPVAVALAVGIAMVRPTRSWRERRRMATNMAALTVVAFVVFVPLCRYSVEYPHDFWRRTEGRLFGDAVMETTDAHGNLIARTPTMEEELGAFRRNVPALLDNFRNALLMYTWKGDVAWISNAPRQPALDPVAGGLLVLGVAAWLARMVRRRDPFDWALIPLILVMMLPSALSIAYPIENPSATRISGTLPGIYLLTALPLAMTIVPLPQLMGKVGSGLAVVGAAALVLASLNANSRTYFQKYRASYVASSLPYTAGGRVLRAFAQKDGYGNAFMLAYPYWWDYRALAIEAGRIDWANAIAEPSDVPAFLRKASERTGELRFDPNRDVLFIYSADDRAAQAWLLENFPRGGWNTVTTTQARHSFNVYRVAAPGADGFARFLMAHHSSAPFARGSR
jgi:hypothetical protein